LIPDSGEHKVRPYLRAFAGEKENLAVDLGPGKPGSLKKKFPVVNF
jgi:hypothetical protein